MASHGHCYLYSHWRRGAGLATYDAYAWPSLIRRSFQSCTPVIIAPVTTTPVVMCIFLLIGTSTAGRRPSRIPHSRRRLHRRLHRPALAARRGVRRRKERTKERGASACPSHSLLTAQRSWRCTKSKVGSATIHTPPELKDPELRPGQQEVPCCSSRAVRFCEIDSFPGVLNPRAQHRGNRRRYGGAARQRVGRLVSLRFHQLIE